MPRLCKVCTHPEKDAIERDLTTSTESIRQIAERWPLSESSLRRHRAMHLPTSMVRGHKAHEYVHGADLLDRLEAAERQTAELAKEALAILKAARENGNLNTALKAVETALKAQARQDARTELVAKLRGLLDSSTRVNVGVGVQVSSTTPEEDARDFEQAAGYLEAALSGMDIDTIGQPGALPDAPPDVIDVEPKPAPDIPIRWPKEAQ